MSNLLIVTQSYPWGKGESFFAQELSYLKRIFHKIVILPYNYGGCAHRRWTAKEIVIYPPIRPENITTSKLFLSGIFNFIGVGQFLFDLLANVPQMFKRGNFEKWFRSTVNLRMILSGRVINAIIKQHKISIVYFYWATPIAAIIYWFPKTILKVIRFHGGDLYLERPENNGYIPFRRMVFKNMTYALCVSLHGINYLRKFYQDRYARIKLFRLGVQDNGINTGSTDFTLRLLSCSAVSNIKRVGLILEALSVLKINILWTHIGDGPFLPIIREEAKRLPGWIRCLFTGNLSNRLVIEYYQNNPVDLFVNVSTFEGLPVSVMEALSFGVPVFATDVGGTAELIDDTVGKLLPCEIDPTILAQQVVEFSELDQKERGEYRKRARERWRELVDGDRCFPKLVAFYEKILSTLPAN